ncbi:MAG: IclR family transcriptional regulator [Achromobacter sp.]|jgi:IclR family pca regulon transcriptional regulator
MTASSSSDSTASHSASAGAGAVRDEPDDRLFVASVEKGMRILEVFEQHTGPLSLADIAARTGMGRSAAQRFVYTLHWLGYLKRDTATRHYFPANKLFGLVRGMTGTNTLRDSSYPILAELARDTRETVSWVELDGDEVVVVVNVPSTHITSINLSMGSRFPALTSSSGQVLLSQAPLSQILEMLTHLPPDIRARFGDRDTEEILALFEKARRNGYSLTEKNLDQNGVSISAPVTDVSGRIVGAVNLSTLAQRFDVDAVRHDLLPRVLQAARAISA